MIRVIYIAKRFARQIIQMIRATQIKRKQFVRLQSGPKWLVNSEYHESILFKLAGRQNVVTKLFPEEKKAKTTEHQLHPYITSQVSEERFTQGLEELICG